MELSEYNALILKMFQCKIKAPMTKYKNSFFIWMYSYYYNMVTCIVIFIKFLDSENPSRLEKLKIKYEFFE